MTGGSVISVGTMLKNHKDDPADAQIKQIEQNEHSFASSASIFSSQNGMRAYRVQGI